MTQLPLRILLAASVLAGVPGITNAQQAPAPAQFPPLVQLGGISVPSCSLASDSEYGLVIEKSIEIGGGATFVAVRERRFLDALRGPEGQPIRVLGRATAPLRRNEPEPTVIDVYSVTYEGRETPIRLYLDAYHFSQPKVPRGFTCASPLPTALGLPPVDPFRFTTESVALAIELGAVREFAPVGLGMDGSTTHGLVFDQFRMIAMAARVAAAAGSPLDPKVVERSRPGLTILAHPVMCNGRTVAAQSVEIPAAQGPLPPMSGPIIWDKAEIEKLLPGVVVPESSVAARYGLA